MSRYVDEIKGFHEEFIGVDVDSVYNIVKEIVDNVKSDRSSCVRFYSEKNKYFNRLVKAIPRAIRIEYFSINWYFGPWHKELSEL